MMKIPDLTELLKGTPRFGGTEEIDDVRRYVSSVRDSAEDFARALDSAAQHLSYSESDATGRLDRVLEEHLVPGASSLQVSSGDASRALTRFSKAVAEIHSDADQTERRAAEHLWAIGVASTSISDICGARGIPFAYRWDTPPSQVMPESGHAVYPATGAGAVIDLSSTVDQRWIHESDWRIAARDWESSATEAARARATWLALIEDRRAAETELQRSISGTAIGELISLAGQQAEPQGDVIRFQLIGRTLGPVWEDGRPRTSHPGLQSLIGSQDGSAVWSSPPSPDDVAARWKAMPEAQREALIAEVPWVIGNLPGIAFVDRDRANRLMLEYYITHQENLSAKSQQALAEVSRVVYGGGDEPPISVVSLDLSDGIPLVSIGYGALDEAEALGWAVPGMLNDADQALPAWHRAMRNQFRVQSTQLETDAGDISGDVKSVALIAFLSYDTPNLATVLDAQSARAGGARLAAEFDGAFATRVANIPLLRHGGTGHSYGTTTLAEAAALVAHELSYVTFVGSAGIDSGSIASFEDLNVALDEEGNPQVYTTIAESDFLARFGAAASGRMQPNIEAVSGVWPTVGGAYSFSSDGTDELRGVQGHGILNENESGYFNLDTQSSDSIAAIAAGRPHEVRGGVRRTEPSGTKVDPGLLPPGMRPVGGQ